MEACGSTALSAKQTGLATPTKPITAPLAALAAPLALQARKPNRVFVVEPPVKLPLKHFPPHPGGLGVGPELEVNEKP